MFVAAFPLGPFFALLTAVIQIRVDAINFVSQFRRPHSTRTRDIGAWLRILEIVTKMSVVVNAFVLAFTSEFIPKLVYKLNFAPDRNGPGGGTLKGYLNNSLASINVSFIYQQEPGTAPRNIQGGPDICRLSVLILYFSFFFFLFLIIICYSYNTYYITFLITMYMHGNLLLIRANTKLTMTNSS